MENLKLSVEDEIILKDLKELVDQDLFSKEDFESKKNLIYEKYKPDLKIIKLFDMYLEVDIVNNVAREIKMNSNVTLDLSDYTKKYFKPTKQIEEPVIVKKEIVNSKVEEKKEEELSVDTRNDLKLILEVVTKAIGYLEKDNVENYIKELTHPIGRVDDKKDLWKFKVSCKQFTDKFKDKALDYLKTIKEILESGKTPKVNKEKNFKYKTHYSCRINIQELNSKKENPGITVRNFNFYFNSFHNLV